MKIDLRPQLMASRHRAVNYLRMSVTDRCNLNCRYCAPSRPVRMSRDRLLSLEELAHLARVAVNLGISKIRLTGGEPLVRRGIVGFIEKLQELCRQGGLQDLSLTTNGTLFGNLGGRLRRAGLRRVNISLDTLVPQKFHSLTGVDLFSAVWEGIHTAADLGFDPIKINTVVMKGVNDDEIETLAGLSLKYPFHVRFIEYMPIGAVPAAAHRFFYPAAQIKKRLQDMGTLISVARGANDGPSERYRFQGAPGEVGLIGSMSNHFCGSCNRLRLTASGCLHPCLLSEEKVDVVTTLRREHAEADLASLFQKAVSLKNDRHHLSFDGRSALQTRMISMGG